MAQLPMYPAKTGSPYTTTTAGITTSDTSISVVDLGVLPAAPGICLLYESSTKYERCIYSAKSGSSGAGTITVSRSGDGHASTDGSNGPLVFDSGIRVLRTITSYDHDLFKANIEDLETRKITASGVTYENLSTNGDIGTGSTQVSQGNHSHSDKAPIANPSFTGEVVTASYKRDTSWSITSQSYVAGNWYRLIQTTTSNLGISFRAKIFHSSKHQVVEVSLAKGTGPDSGSMVWTAEINTGGVYAYSPVILEVRVVNDGANQPTYIDVNFAADVTCALIIAIEYIQGSSSALVSSGEGADMGTTAVGVVFPIANIVRSWGCSKYASGPIATLDASGNFSVVGNLTADAFNSITGLSSLTPLIDGTAAIGVSTNASRADHVHPTDTSRAAASHSHGNVTTDGKVGSTANLPLITTTAGAIMAGSFGTDANTFCQGNDSRLSNDRNPAISAMTAETDIAADDYLPVYDASATANRKATVANLLSSRLNELTRSIILLGSSAEVPASSGGAADTVTVATNGQIIAGTKFEAGSSDLYAQWRFRLPYNYKSSTGFKYKVGFLVKTASGASTTVIFGLQALIVGDGGTIDTAWGTAVELTTDVSSVAANVLKISAESAQITPALAPSGLTVAGGEEIFFRIYRKGTDTSAADVLLTDVYLTYTTDKYEDV